MYTLKLVDGDFSLIGDGNFQRLTGAERIKQELSCWILEPFGTDKSYPKFGSTLDSMIGNPIIDQNLAEVRNEVQRVVNNYVSYQQNQISQLKTQNIQDVYDAWDDDDIIKSVDAIEVSAIADTVTVAVTLTTNAGMEISVNQEI